MIGQLTKNFHADEFKCKDGSPVPMEYKANLIELATNLQVLRDVLKRKITITSGYRSPERNKKVGGAKNSAHLTAKAADIKVEGLQPRQVKIQIEELIKRGMMKNGGIGLYSSWLHYDISTPRRWSK
jgi:uncharacterized protein YcbK (DUF882 family)